MLLGVDVWVHVVATVRGPTDMTFYDDGVDGTGGYAGTGGAMVHNGWPAHIGRNAQNTPAQYLDGLLDDIRIFDRSLTAEEILQLFNEGGWN